MSPAHRPLTMLLLASLPLCASGPMGHSIASSHTIRQINEGKMEVPRELAQVLRDPECQRAFNGGAVGPDLAEGKTHYGNTAELSQRMLNAAREDMRRAAAERDEAGFQEAKKEMAFAYGWLSHCATDLNTHPSVNARTQVGDSYRYLDKGGKAAHGAMEAQETAYLKQTVWNPADKYDVYVPYRFLSKQIGVPAPTLINAAKVLKGKAAAELVAASKVKLSHEELRRLWESTVRGGFQDTRDFLKNPSSMKNWDLDCGRISTAEFDALRALVKDLNGGKLPEGWGRNYMAWYGQLQGLSKEERLAKLRQILGLTPPEPPKTATPPTPKPSAAPSGGGSASGIFPGEPFNGLQITYAIAGASISSSSDHGGFTNGRVMSGTLSGSELRVTGSVKGTKPACNTWAGSFYTTLSVTVWVDDQRRTFNTPTPSTCEAARESYEFSVAVPIPAGAKVGGFSIDETYVNPRFGNRGLVVSGSLKRD